MVYGNVRTTWPNEALDFTPWLARNLDQLGSSIGLKLRLLETEKKVGSLFLDIFAEEVDRGSFVAIENQLDRTDIDHFGRLMTYATSCKTPVVIWIAHEFRYESAEALHRLNEWTKEEIRFYGVKLDVYKTKGNSSLKPLFRTVVSPGWWNEGLTLRPDPPPPKHAREFDEFYRPLVHELTGKGDFDRPILYCGHTGRLFRSRLHEGIGYAVSLEKYKDAWVTLNIRTAQTERTNAIFDKLRESRDEIETGVNAGPNAEWAWHKHEPYQFSSINIRKDGSLDDSETLQEETRAWMQKNLIVFREFFEENLTKLVGSPLLGDQEF